MPVATTTQAGREVLSPAAEKILDEAERKRKLAAAKRAADMLTPLATEQLPEPPPLFPDDAPAAAAPPAVPRTLILSVTIIHRGRQITISSEGRSLDAFCDMLDARLGVAS